MQTVHDPVSAFLNKADETSFLLPIPALKDTIINGKDIPVAKGYYNYQGNVSIHKNKVTVNLIIDNTDNKKQQPLDWNGEYNMVGH